jgi:hypothetical protein
MVFGKLGTLPEPRTIYLPLHGPSPKSPLPTLIEFQLKVEEEEIMNLKDEAHLFCLGKISAYAPYHTTF